MGLFIVLYMRLVVCEIKCNEIICFQTHKKIFFVYLDMTRTDI